MSDDTKVILANIQDGVNLIANTGLKLAEELKETAINNIILQQRCDELQRKLNIAVEALRLICGEAIQSGYSEETAREALKKLEAL